MRKLYNAELDNHATSITNNLIANVGLTNAGKISIRIRRLLAKEKFRRKNLKNRRPDVYPEV